MKLRITFPPFLRLWRRKSRLSGYSAFEQKSVIEASHGGDLDVGDLTRASLSLRQGTTFNGACQNAAFWPVGSSTVIWHTYSPSSNLSRGTESLIGTAFDFESMPVLMVNGAISKTFSVPRKNVTKTATGCMVSAPRS